MKLDAWQLRQAVEFAAPDYERDEDQRGTELVFQRLPERLSTEGEKMEAGMYCWYAEYPEEGCMLLDAYDDLPASPTTGSAAPDGRDGR